MTERHLIFHNDIQQIPQLACFVEAIAEEASLDQSLAMSLNLALEEAVTNVIMYAYPAGSDGLVSIEAVIRDDALEFILSDSGIPFDPTEAREADVTLAAEDRPTPLRRPTQPEPPPPAPRPPAPPLTHARPAR